MVHFQVNRPFAGSLIVLLLSGMAMPGTARTVAVLPTKETVSLAEDKKEEEPKGDPIDVDQLPKAVVDAVKKAYPGAKITKAAKLEDGNYFLDDVNVGKKVWDLTVTPKGKIVKRVEMKEGD